MRLPDSSGSPTPTPSGTLASLLFAVVSVGVGAGTGSPTAVVLPMLVGALAFLIVAGTIVMFDPLLILGDDEADIDRRPRAAARR
ncbi:hypothetical protein ACFQ64_30070 [Streptomyces sp. NPDC056460]|uniref:hypothetical protein n=1 Tax=Streptomyces sp. NPDC056460 TaxID=3345825 RepID=UPI0036CC24D2